MENARVTDSTAYQMPKVFIEKRDGVTAEPEARYGAPAAATEEKIKQLKKAVEKAAKELDFIEAARLKEELLRLQKLLNERK